MNLDIGPSQIFFLMAVAAIFKNGHWWLLAWNALPSLQLLYHVFSTTNII